MKKLLFVIAFFIVSCDKNSEPRYNPETGRPINCRAIIKDNIEAYRKNIYSAEDVLDSINRNCGEFGYSWGR